MKFQLLGKEIEISEGRKNYIKIISDFTELATQAEIEFKEEYEDTFGLVILSSTWRQKFLNTYGSESFMDNIVRRYVSKARQYLVNYGVYDLTDTAIWNNAIVTEERSVSQLQHEFDSFIVECLCYAEEYEEDDDAFTSRIKSKFSGNFFPTHLYNDVMSLCDYVLKYLYDNKIIEIQYVYKDDAEKANAYYSNLMDTVITEEDELSALESIVLKNNSMDKEISKLDERRDRISDSSKEQLAYELINLNPRKKEYYEYIFENLSHAKYEVSAIANFLNIDLSELIENEIKQDFDIKSISCEEEALKMMDDLRISMEKYCVTESSRKAELEKILNDFDIKARTYDGVLYETRELCSQAEKDDQALYELHGDISSVDKEICNRFVAEISNIQCDKNVKDKHIKLLKERINAIDKEYLESLLTTIDDSDEIECNYIKEKIEQYNALEEIKAPFVSRVEKRIYTIWDAEDFERFKEIFTQTPVSNSEQVGKNCSIIRESGRTETKELFIKALYLLNETAVEAAAKYAVAKEGGFFASLINMGKKETYEILTLNGRVIHPAILDAMETVKAKKGNGILSGFGFGKNKAKQQPVQTQTSVGAKFCPSCGTKTDGVSKFCSNCGNKLV